MNSNVARNAAANTTSRLGGLASNLTSMMGEKGPIIILIAVVLLAFVAVVIYISFSLKASNLKGKRLTKTPVKLDDIQTPIVVESGDIPKAAVGREYSYSFWFYLDSFSQTNQAPQMIFYRGSQGTIADANPLVLMDGNNNKLHFVIKTQGSSLSSTTPSIDYETNLNNIFTRSYFLNKDLPSTELNVHKHMILSVDYVPMQRWVNLVIVIDNKIITIFMDGEIYSVKTVDEYKMTKQPEFDARGNKVDYNLVVEKSEGGLFLGKYKNATTPSAYFSNLEYYNYAISLNDVKRIYINGPFSKNFLNFIGISSYGVRSPIYKIDEYQANK